MFAKLAHKPTESYVISRIWHRLDDIRVRFVLQQYVKRPNGYALADLFLPQINMIVEVNEKYHETDEQKLRDAIRNAEVRNAAKADVFVIRGSGNLDEIHRQVDDIVAEIRKRIAAQGESFLPCDYSVTRTTPEYCRLRGFFKVSMEDGLANVDDIAAVFGTTARHNGYLRAPAVGVPGKKDEIVWWPQRNHPKWNNELSEDGVYIYEYNKKSAEERARHVAQWINSGQRRITFMKRLIHGGLGTYDFVGVFQINAELSKEKNMCVWERISDTYQLYV